MRKVIILITLAASTLLVSGCDFVKKIAGRPSSDEVYMLSLAKKSSLDVADFVASDTLSADISRGSEPVLEIAGNKTVIEPEEQVQPEQPDVKPVKEPESTTLTIRHWGKNINDNAGLARYYVSVGIFSSETNARNQAKWASNSGYTPTIILFNNGRFCVCVCPSETVSGINSQLDKLLKKPFCPADAFIIDTQK